MTTYDDEIYSEAENRNAAISEAAKEIAAVFNRLGYESDIGHALDQAFTIVDVTDSKLAIKEINAAQKEQGS